MAITYPTSLDNFTNPLSTDLLTSPDHATQHANANDAIEAIETAIGTTGAPVLAKLASPTFTGVPSAPTAAPITNTTQIATTAFVTTADNLKANLASPTFTGTVTAPTFTGALTGNASTVTTNANLTGDVTSVGNATTLTNAPVIAKVLTGYVSGSGTVAATDSILQAVQKLNGNDGLKANIASPTFTGIPAAPTATAGTSTTQLATTAFVTAADQLLGTYTAYTTTLTNVTVGNGVISGSYCRVNGFVHYYGSFTLGSTSAVTGTVSFTLPVDLNSDMNIRSTYGTFQYLDGSTRYNGQSQRNTNSSLFMCVDLTNGTYAQSSLVASTTPFTWGDTDVMTWNLYYRAA